MQDDQEPQDDFGHIPFDEDDEDGTSPAGPRMSHATTTEGDDSLRLSGIGVDDSRGSRDISIGGLSDGDMGAAKRKAPEDDDQEEEAPKRPIRKRKRKRRKVVVDNEDTELSTEHIRDMLADTHDLVRKARHPADPADSDDDNDDDYYDEENDDNQVGSSEAFYRRLHKAPHPNKVWDQHLTMPFVAKSGELPPAMMRMFTDSYYRALGTKPLYKLLNDGEREQVEEFSDEEDSVEETRKQQKEGTDDDESEPEFPNDNEEPIGQNMDAEEGQEPQEDGFQVPMDDDDELAPTVVDDEEDSDLDVGHQEHARGRDSVASKFITSEFADLVRKYSPQRAAHVDRTCLLFVCLQAPTSPSSHWAW
jgi:hypothetical protein